MIPLEQEDPELADLFADWFSGGHRHRWLSIGFYEAGWRWIYEKFYRKIQLYGKVGRNEPCPCGSGKKYKKCCG